MQNQDLTQLSVSQLGHLIQRRDVSPVEVAVAFIRRIDALEPRLNAFITRVDEHALQSAREAEEEILRGDYRGPFHGIPVGLKDLFWTKDIRTTSGSLIDGEFVPAEDSAVASRIKAAGAYCIGKLHMTEFAFDGTSLNPHYGPARNPWDLARMAGGSSSGPGAAVAGGHRCLPVLRGHRHRHRRVGARACGAVRHHGPQAHLWPHQQVWRHPPVLVHGPRRPHDQNRGGRGPGSEHAGGL